MLDVLFIAAIARRVTYILPSSFLRDGLQRYALTDGQSPPKGR